MSPGKSSILPMFSGSGVFRKETNPFGDKNIKRRLTNKAKRRYEEKEGRKNALSNHAPFWNIFDGSLMYLFSFL